VANGEPGPFVCGTTLLARSRGWNRSTPNSPRSKSNSAGVESLDPSRFRHAEDIAASERECRQLAEEWAAAADVTAEERAFVAALAVRAEQLALELRRAHDRAQRAVQERLDELRENWDALQRGRSMLGKYRVRRDDEGGLIDKQA